jgi:hypothetical protein
MGEPWSSANVRCLSHLAALCGKICLSLSTNKKWANPGVQPM